MTSQIDPTLIITTFPVAGKDNDTQGFRDNFAGTRAGLQHARDEISELQSKAIVSMGLNSTSPAENNFGGSTIYDGLYKQFDGVYRNSGTVALPTLINVSSGPVQKFTVAGGTSVSPIILTFDAWSLAGRSSNIRIILVGDNVETRYVQFSTTGGGVLKRESGLSFPFAIPTGYVYEIFDAFTVDGGSTVFLKHYGQF